MKNCCCGQEGNKPYMGEKAVIQEEMIDNFRHVKFASVAITATAIIFWEKGFKHPSEKAVI